MAKSYREGWEIRDYVITLEIMFGLWGLEGLFFMDKCGW